VGGRIPLGRARGPSAVVPFEENVLLNPLHPSSPAVRVVDRAPFTLDPRL
jgi:hypothetical protein